MRIARAQASEVAKASELLWGNAFPFNDDTIQGLWVACENDRLCGAVYGISMPGGSSLLHPPATGDRVVEDLLMWSALESLTPAIQTESFLRPNEMERGPILERHGFRHTTTILEMSAPKRLPTSVNFNEKPIAASLLAHKELKQLLSRCHEDSLDCPEVNANHTEGSLWSIYVDLVPDLGRWLVATRQGKPVGIAICSEHDLCFLGVIPEARQQGIGKQLLSVVLTQFAPLQVTTDLRNQPAVSLYRQMGFVVTGQREFFLRPNRIVASASSFNEE